MLKRLTCQNWQQHRELVVDFVGGFNVIRGENEAGKSALLRAICYAGWGSRALPEGLDEYVTWGEPVSSLKVTLEFSHDNIDYTVTRKKSGAELHGGAVSVYGQAEVTATIEQMFKASYQTAFSTLIANQGNLQSGLDGSAMQLIEKLSGMQLIDDLITKIQERLPSGNTKALDAQIAQAQDITAPTVDYTAIWAEIAKAGNEDNLHAKALAEALETLTAVSGKATEARQTLAEQSTLAQTIKGLRKRLDDALPLAVPPTLEPVADIQALMAARDAQSQRTASLKSYQAFRRLNTAMWYAGGVEAFVKDAHQTAAMLEKVNKALKANAIEIARADAMRITQTACGLCGKDLSEVAEVVTKNAQITAQILELTTNSEELKREQKNLTSRLAELTEFDKVNTANNSIITMLGSYVKPSEDRVPVIAEWVGEVPDENEKLRDYSAEINAAMTAQTRNQRRTADCEVARNSVATLTQSLQDAEERVQSTEGCEQAIQNEAVIVAHVKDCRTNAAMAAYALQTAKSKETAERQAYESALARYEQALAALVGLQDVRNQMLENNALVVKLRQARPVVAAQLWGTMLSGISSMFSNMRGQASIVTRSENAFLIDGKKASVFSGSTRDILGLAIRVMLQKTFLGGVDFLLLDEPAAACSDNRESELLAAVAAAGYEQVLVVTHSDIADAFATNVISL